MPKTKITALYCRVAREDDDAIALQEAMLKEYSREHGYDIVFVYADNGESGLNFDRPALSRLEADINAGRVSTVIVRSIDRISRDYIKNLEWVEKNRCIGVSFISISDGFGVSHFDVLSRSIREFLAPKKNFEKNPKNFLVTT